MPATPASSALSSGSPELTPLIVPSRLHTPPIANARPLPVDQDLIARARLDAQGRLAVHTPEGEAPLTLDPKLQEELTKLLDRFDTPYGAVVVMEPSTGKVLAMAEHSGAEPQMRGLPTKAIFPAASVFKLVTASALLEKGVSPTDGACIHGGRRRIKLAMLEDSVRDRSCLTLTQALARSANAVFAKLTHRDLTARALLDTAERLGFNRTLRFPIPTDMSLAAVPDDTLGLAQTGAGFGDVFLSPLHGALLASTIANRGLWHPPVLFEKNLANASHAVRVLPVQIADEVAAMMAETVRMGSARRLFHQRGYALRDAAGKTGSLSDKHPVFRDYTWFVGFAPRENPKVAVAAVVVNGFRWRIKGTYVGREALRMALKRADQNLVRR